MLVLKPKNSKNNFMLSSRTCDIATPCDILIMFTKWLTLEITRALFHINLQSISFIIFYMKLNSIIFLTLLFKSLSNQGKINKYFTFNTLTLISNNKCSERYSKFNLTINYN